MTNLASGNGAMATQNLSSNFGRVLIAGYSEQTTALQNASISNAANGARSHAIQNIASNDACDEPRDPCPTCH